MPKYRVKQGKKFGSGGQFPAGTILELTEEEASGFMDKLEPALDSALVGSTQEVVPHEDLQFKNELGVEVPEELKLMPGTLSAEDESDDEIAEESEPAEEEPAVAPKTTHRSAGKSTRKRAHED